MRWTILATTGRSEVYRREHHWLGLVRLRLAGVLRRLPAPDHIRSDNGGEFTATAVREWLTKVGVRTSFIEPGRSWENGCVESFYGTLRDELRNGEIFDALLEAKVLMGRWREHYNRARSHSALGYRPPAPETILLPGVIGGSAPEPPEPPASKPNPESTGNKTCIKVIPTLDGLTERVVTWLRGCAAGRRTEACGPGSLREFGARNRVQVP